MSKEKNFIVSITNKTLYNDIIWAWKVTANERSYVAIKRIDGESIVMCYNPNHKSISIGNDYVDLTKVDDDDMDSLRQAILGQFHDREHIESKRLEKQKERRYEMLLDTGLSW